MNIVVCILSFIVNTLITSVLHSFFLTSQKIHGIILSSFLIAHWIQKFWEVQTIFI